MGESRVEEGQIGGNQTADLGPDSKDEGEGLGVSVFAGVSSLPCSVIILKSNTNFH